MKALYFDNSLTKAVALKALSVFDKYAALGKLSPSQYAEVPEPTLPNARWLKVRNRSCGLCGTDVHFLFMEMDPGVFAAATPGIKRKFLGHELVGEVIEAGAEVDPVAVGDRVAMRIDWPRASSWRSSRPAPAAPKAVTCSAKTSASGSCPTATPAADSRPG